MKKVNHQDISHKNSVDMKNVQKKYLFQYLFELFFLFGKKNKHKSKFLKVPKKFIEVFDQENYLDANSDVLEGIEKKQFDSALEHFIYRGYNEVKEGKRKIGKEFPYFSKEAYLRANFDIQRAIEKGSFVSAFDHFIHFGYREFLRGERILVNERSNLHGAYTGNIEFFSLPLVSTPSIHINFKIAVVIHAFYIDVLEDIISSLDHIFPRPDLFISVSEDANVKDIEDFLKERGYVNFIITPVQNRGRDVAPFLVEFSDTLKSYDLCCKIHGKKSLYGGSEQSNWRNHLYHNLLGSKEIVDDILSAFVENKKLGLLFSDNYGMIPYWAYTWLTNKGVVAGLLHRLKLQELAPILDQTYIDYPAGTMFWFRPKAIVQILDSDIDYKDFPEEPIGNDGTIAHGLERLFSYVTRLNGYDYIEQNRELMQYTKNITHKNFNQHQAKTLQTAKNIVSDKECIIFDIFDTLVARTIFYPDNLFRIIEQEFDEKVLYKIRLHESAKRDRIVS